MTTRKAGPEPWVVFLAMWGALAALLWAAGTARGVPYNVRELFSGPRGWMAVLALPLVGNLGAGVPAAMACWLGGGSWRRAAALPAMAVFCGVIAFGLLRATVSVESIWDIVGTPVLHGPGDWEIAGRFVALFALIWTLVAGGAAAALALDSREGRRALAAWMPGAILVLLAGYVVVVEWAATDNLTELMRGGGDLGGAAALAGWFLVVGGGAALASRAVAGSGGAGAVRLWGIAVAAVAVSYPAGYWLLSLGTAAHIEKYGATFSALQFLLSPDREHYATGSALLSRYGLAHTLAWSGIALAQLPQWLAARAR